MLKWGAAALPALALGLGLAAASEDAPAPGDGEAAPEFTEDFLADPDAIAAGQALWEDQCRHCHGRSAYPGKAPKLRPRRYNADFVYDRITNGFRQMPAWGEIYTDEERMQLVAYILSDGFSP